MNPLETYLKEMRDIRSTGAAVAETSFYPVLSNLLNEIGKTLKPKVRCVINIANAGAGIPDGGLFTPDQFQKATDAAPKEGQLPGRGVLEVKGPADDVAKVAASAQVKKYSDKYGLVLVTNYRDFLLLGRDAQGNPLPIEGFALAATEAAFWQLALHPQPAAKEHGERFCEYIKRVMLSVAPLSAPQDVAWFLASYARDAKARVENHKDLSALAAVREALEEALGMKFTGEKGEHFFRSTLVQTIFYGVFSAWMLWHRERPDRDDKFDWRSAQWSLRVPFISALYNQVATPSQLGPLGLVEVLDWTAAALNRVDRAAFFQKFQDEHAVQYFYEPFLEAFDPELRKELGVWYTPPEIVQYQVARVDTVLREELGLADGLADPNVVVLDPCCGTGAYLVEVLKKIAETLKDKGGDALIASDLKKAAMTRVFGFEILPAPFVVSHLQLGLMLQGLGAPLSPKGSERVGVYLTNSLTGWEPPKDPKKLLFPELAAERDAADSVKRDKQILVILGNPPYNGFAGLAVTEERELSNAYRTTQRAPKPKGQGLNDLFVRFFRMAERRIVEKSGKGVVCFISNYAWLDGLSYNGMRERYLEAFDRIAIDCLNGDKYKTGKLTPDGESDPSVFSTDFNREGIQVGTAIALLVRKSHVGQPPSAVPDAPPRAAELHAELQVEPGLAKPSSMQYRRHLPHIQNLDRPLYVTFCTQDRWILPEEVRNLVIRHCLYEHGRKCWIHTLIVMPDHVHMILSLYRDAQGAPFGLAEIMNGIKGASAHSINKALGRKGTVWQNESFDHVLRNSESIESKGDYIWNNPVRKGLVKEPDQWPWFWGDWMDLPPGCAAVADVGQPPAAVPDAQPRAAELHLSFRHFWGKEKRAELLESLQTGRPPYQELSPPVEIGLPFKPAGVAAGYLA